MVALSSENWHPIFVAILVLLNVSRDCVYILDGSISDICRVPNAVASSFSSSVSDLLLYKSVLD